VAAADVEREYRARLTARRAALAARERSHAAYAYTRLGIFVVAIGILIFGGLDRAGWLLAPLATFAVLAVAHARLLNARDRAASAVAFYERGLDRVAHRWVGKGRDGRHLAPASHLYAEDLDIFGRGSLFELLATTRTHAGEETLAHWMLEPAVPLVVKARQEAVRELAKDLDLRERVAVMGDQLGIGVHADLLRRWSRSPIVFGGLKKRIGAAIVVALTLTAGVWWYRTDTHTAQALLLAAIALQLIVASIFKERVHGVIEAVAEPSHDLDLLADLLRAIETGSFQSTRLRELQATIRRSGKPASVEIARLSQLVGMLSSRESVFFAIPAGVLMWGTQWAFAIEGWRARAGRDVPVWLDAVGEFEALLALGTLSAEHPDFAFPVLQDGPAVFEATDLAHPAMPPAAVSNPVALGVASPHLLVVSGSNMSGKSTFLRAIGVNCVLAQMGAPVRASSCRLSPLAIGASIRISDSLTDGRSHFFAEITRVKAIVDLSAAHPGGTLFLLDEILAGTNSHDRRIGSEALLVGLVRSGAIGLVTTHDLALGEIAARASGAAANVHFEDQFVDGTLRFDYRLRPDIVKTSNAIALMRSIGLDV
jgi:hypothetical protein